MNWGVIGVLLVSLALGAAVAACWRYGTTYLSRVTPLVLAAVYYISAWAWPFSAVIAWRTGQHFPEGDQVRWMLLGISLLVAIVELIARLHRAVQNNKRLRAKLGYRREEEL